GMDRLVQRNVLAMSGRAVEAAGDVTTLLLDKTGTITYGNRRAHEVLALPGVDGEELLHVAALSSLADPTPEGASIVELAAANDIRVAAPEDAVVVPFTAQTRMSGLDLADGTQIRKGAGSAVRAWLGLDGDDVELTTRADAVAESGGTPLVVAVKTPGADGRVLGVVHLKDIVKDGLRERFEELRAMGIRTVMI
ncbi:HAD family hydrolase, partial [Microbacterium maritypicum]|uniref:HAD family hydrolase n=1 Tax=Microbacterium maritypicum TaxID=33918 RepID=UPI0004CEC624